MRRSSINDSFRRIRSRMATAGKNVLILDYDGTLAPFRIDPSKAVPYPGVTEAMAKIQYAGGPLFILTGREPEEVRILLGINPSPEIWGCHGAVRLLPDGSRENPEIGETARIKLDEAEREALALGIGRVERKTTSVALHWRGECEEDETRMRRAISEAWGRMGHAGFSVEKFDGGLELRMEGFDKGRAVAAIMAKYTQQDFAAFLGDDQTDEEGFAMIRKLGGLGVLVRQKCRDTAAALWLKPPEALMAFLELWLKGVTEGSASEL